MHLGVLATLTLAGSYLSLSLPVCISVWFLSFIDCSLSMWGAGTAWKPKWTIYFFFLSKHTTWNFKYFRSSSNLITHQWRSHVTWFYWPSFFQWLVDHSKGFGLWRNHFVLLQKSVKRKCCIVFLAAFLGIRRAHLWSRLKMFEYSLWF